MKFQILKSFRFKIILSFLSIIFIALILFFGYSYITTKTNQLQNVLDKITEIESDFSGNAVNLQAFLLYGYKTPEFYKTNREENIDRYVTQLSSQQEHLGAILFDLKKNQISISPTSILNLNSGFKHLDSLSRLLKEKRYQLGFRDYGQIGGMRQVAHNIEDESILEEKEILRLRRHEKDLLLRSDSVYILNFNDLTDDFRFKYKDQIHVLDSINKYQSLFESVSDLYFEIGTENNGLYGKVNELTDQISNEIKTINESAQSQVIIKKQNIERLVQVFFGVILIVIAFLITYLSLVLTRDLKRLQTSIYRFIKSDFKDFDDIKETSKILEVDFLYQAYDLLRQNLLQNIDGLKMTIEELERTTAYKSSFLANMSHEIRTPLNGIISVVNLLYQTKLNNKQLELLEIANYSSSHLLGLINLILDYSKISAGKMELEHRAIDLQKDLKKLIKVFEFPAKEKGIELKFDYNIADKASTLLFGDTIRINQIIINLLNNSIKFTEKGSVSLIVDQFNIDKDIDQITINVEDTGIGISSEKADKIFQAFEQIDKSTTRKYGGTGLGLTISNELANLMGSVLQYEPIREGGSRFFFKLHLKRANVKTKKYEKSSLMDNLPKINEKTQVLIVDDNSMNQKVLGLMLKKFNIKINYANNGLEAVELAAKDDYSMIFMDIQMPIMDGLEATKQIKATMKFKNNPIPIIAVSASAYSDDIKKANNAGIDDFISKPIEVKKLHDLLIKHSLRVS